VLEFVSDSFLKVTHEKEEIKYLFTPLFAIAASELETGSSDRRSGCGFSTDVSELFKLILDKLTSVECHYHL
jgi:hypothetical protein